MMHKLNLPRFHFSLFISILGVIFTFEGLYPTNCCGQPKTSVYTLVEKELIQYTLSPDFERIVRQFIQEGEKTFYKDGPVLMSAYFDQYGCDIEGYSFSMWTNVCIFSDNILGYFMVSGHGFIIYGTPKSIEGICFKGTQKHKFETWDDRTTIMFIDPNIFCRILKDEDGQFRITEKYYDPDVK